MNRRFSFGSAVACLFVGSIAAHAADLTRPASPSMTYKASPAVPFSWTGFYIGVNGGYAGGTSGWSDPGVGADSGKFNTSGGLLGGQIGYNWQTGPMVLGLESDADWMSVKGNTAGAGGVCLADGGGLCQTQQSWVGTTRARVGYAVDRWLPYITAGAAYGNIQAAQPTGTTSATNFGWTAGAGVEVALDRNWSAKLEYLHIDLGTANFVGSASGTQTLLVPATNDLVRAGVNFRFN
jgi:outer membrane immunogenic protein